MSVMNHGLGTLLENRVERHIGLGQDIGHIRVEGKETVADAVKYRIRATDEAWFLNTQGDPPRYTSRGSDPVIGPLLVVLANGPGMQPRVFSLLQLR
jgi:hypothetical protein